ncbi:MAG: hypothetical protein KAI79_16865 [Bacteroidales bacterium]|nr:hypothetical protein [Bacteroidales bacterium]
MTRTKLQEKLLKETKYSKWYLNIIFKANSQNRTKLKKTNESYHYYEEHHILPQAEGLFEEYQDLKLHTWNGVLLTAREHFICHRLIQKHYSSLKYTFGDRKMSRAIDFMSKMGKYNSKGYENFKLDLTCDKETRVKISKSLKGKNVGKNNPNYGNQYTEEILEKMRKPKSKEHNRKNSEAHKDKKLTEEHKLNIGISGKGKLKGRKQTVIKCPHCNKKGGNSMKMWHFDKCKLNKLNCKELI